MVKKFKIFPRFDFSSLSTGNENVCIVSVIGKSGHDGQKTKASRLNSYIGAEVFLGEHGRTNPSLQHCQIMGHYSKNLQVIFLELQSSFDASNIITNHNRESAEVTEHIRALVFLFSVSHLVLLVTPVPVFDTSWLRLFEVINTSRLKLQPAVRDILLNDQSASEAWANAGRLCRPRVLFVFDGCHARNSKSPHTTRKLSHALENQVYCLLRNLRIIGNINDNSLFAAPANGEFVHVTEWVTSQPHDNIALCLSLLKQHCDKAKQSDPTVSKNDKDKAKQSDPTVSKNAANNSFANFLTSHLKVAQTKGFNDDNNRGRHNTAAASVFELPSVGTWFKICSALYDFFMIEQSESQHESFLLNVVKSKLDINVRFSESQCAKALAMAENAYQDNLRRHNTEAVHKKNLIRAKKIFTYHARGLAKEKYVKQLEEGCTKIWKNRRQLCEVVSITGNLCARPLHVTPDDEKSADISK